MIQIPVIQNPAHPAVGVPINLSGMLFDPLTATPPGQAPPPRPVPRFFSFLPLQSLYFYRPTTTQFIHGLVPRSMQHLLGGQKSITQGKQLLGNDFSQSIVLSNGYF